MQKMYQHIMKAICCLLIATAVASCALIDDDLSECGTDYELDYELQLVTNMNTELKTQLATNVNVSNALRTQLSSIFTDFAHDVDLSFYDTDDDSLRLQHDEHIMDANQASYELFLPMRQYMHLAAANVVKNDLVTVSDDENCHTARLSQIAGDTIESHTTGIFTARQEMNVLEGVDQVFNVHLYMANSATALVIDPRGHDYKSISVYATGFATGFNICDSVYTYSDKAPIVKATQLPVKKGDELCFCTVNFPSRDSEPTRLVIEGEEPFVAPDALDALWQFRVYTTLNDGSVTESILSITKPLRAGQLKVVKVHLADDQGVVESDDSTVGVNVTLDWNLNTYPDIPL